VVLLIVSITVHGINTFNEVLEVLNLSFQNLLFLNLVCHFEDSLTMRRKSPDMAMKLGVMCAAESSFVEAASYAVCEVLLLLQTSEESVEALLVVQIYKTLQVMIFPIRHLAAAILLARLAIETLFKLQTQFTVFFRFGTHNELFFYG
jgi:hypothetical protein